MRALTISILSMFFIITSNAQEIKFYNTNGIAIKGYDPVGYHLQNKAIEGSDNNPMEWSGSK